MKTKTIATLILLVVSLMLSSYKASYDAHFEEWVDRELYGFNIPTDTLLELFDLPLCGQYKRDGTGFNIIEIDENGFEIAVYLHPISNGTTKPSKYVLMTPTDVARRINFPNIYGKTLTGFETQQAYIKQFQKFAEEDEKISGVPAYITLAQGILESNSGRSPLALRCNNHFGVKCQSTKCKKGHCENFTDDSHKDFFRNYETVLDSYKHHGRFLSRMKRYKKLFKLDRDDYKGWAQGLQDAGYATDPQYASKLIRLIESHKLVT